MPSELKKAIVKPLIKKSSLDKENLKNFRPVSNLPFIGKIIEKIAVTQLDKHLTDYNLHEPLQSAYQANHSTETALLKVTNDILLALDNRKCAYLVLLDLSAAFDTIDHQVFLARLEQENGITGNALDWMESYLTGRQQHITINGTMSDKIDLQFGFPQGSVIGPFGFKLYTKPLTEIAKKHDISIHLYADDTQLYTTFDPEDSEAALSKLEACIEEIRSWMQKNFLKLNNAKTEFIMFGTPHDLSSVSGWTVTVGESEILPSTTARNIGAYLDCSMNLKGQINNTVRACYGQMRSIAKIRKYLTIEATKKLTHAFISSRLDNLNSLLYKLPDCQLKKLQLVQNSAARMIVQQKRSEHITPTLKDLHWLPVSCRIKYKLLLLVFKCLIGKGPAYLSSLLHHYIPTRALRSSNQYHLQEPPTHRKYGERAFSVCGPRLWNRLPLSARQCKTLPSFKTALKTHLFKLGYSL